MQLKIYEASAGSGKTYRLALEYIALALETDQPSAFANTLAVTFTNKATAEMKDRILAQLYNAAHGGLDAGFMNDLVRRLHLAPEVIAQRARFALQSILHDYDRFRVETIDSFFQSLLSDLAHELGLTRGFRVDLDTEDAVSRAVDRLLLSIGHSGKAGQRTARQVMEFMEERIGEDKGWNISRELKSFGMKNLFCSEYLQNEQALSRFFADEDNLRRLKNELRQLGQELLPSLQEAGTLLTGFLNLPPDGVDASQLKGIGGLRTYALALQNGNYMADMNKTMVQALDNANALLKKALQKDAAYVAFAEETARRLAEAESVREKAAPILSTIELTLQKLTPLCLLHEIGNEVGRINAESGTFMLANTPDLFNKMVQKEDSSFVFERAGTTFRHIMIDEFQDTSRQQWNNFKRLILENMAKGDGCMLVGDIKQSIYRWRGGDWEILNNIDSELAHMGTRPIAEQLDTNYRSKHHVVSFNNAFFVHARQALDRLNIQDGLTDNALVSTIYGKVAQKEKPHAEGGYVRIALPDKKDTEEDILEDVFGQITLLHETHHVPFGKMGILVRAKADAVKIIRHFSLHHPEVPLTSDEAFKLTASPGVKLLVHALKYLANPADTVAREACLVMGRALSLQAIGDEVMQTLDDHRAQWLQLPLFEACQRLIALFRLPEAEAEGKGQSAYLHSFLDHLLAFIDENGSDLPGFIAHWDDVLCTKSIAVDIQDSVYIMTVHKSKGLQRHTIFLPFCNWTLDKDFPEDILWCTTGELPTPFSELPLVPVGSYASKKVKASAFAPHYRYEHLQQRIDSINALYVAFTRAEENLLLWSQPKSNSVARLVEEFVNAQAEGEDNGVARPQPQQAASETVKCFGAPEDFHEKAKGEKRDNPLEDNDAETVEVSLYHSTAPVVFQQSNRAKDFIAEAGDEEQDMATDAGVQQSVYLNPGKVIHRVLQQIETAADVVPTLDSMVSQGILTRPERERLHKVILKRLADPRVGRWFDGSWKLFTECNMLTRGADGQVEVKRPDRVMLHPDETVVVDYKYAKFDPEHLTQVSRYLQELRKMGHARVHGHLLYVLTGKIIDVE